MDSSVTVKYMTKGGSFNLLFSVVRGWGKVISLVLPNYYHMSTSGFRSEATKKDKGVE